MVGKDLIMATLFGSGGGSSGSGGGGSAEPIKAFATQPLTNEVLIKNIAPIISVKEVLCKYTDTEGTISGTVTFGAAGTTYVLSLATRNPTSEPMLPDGWNKIAWCEPATGSTANQWLYVAKRTVASGEENTTCEISFDVVVGQRNYLMVVDIGDSRVSTHNTIVSSASNVVALEPDLHENSLVVCSSETSSAGFSWRSDSFCNIIQNVPATGDTGARLAVMYIPHLSQQASEKVNIHAPTYKDTISTGIILCAISLTPGTPVRYDCVLDYEEITAAQALAILLGGEDA